MCLIAEIQRGVPAGRRFPGRRLQRQRLHFSGGLRGLRNGGDSQRPERVADLHCYFLRYHYVLLPLHAPFQALNIRLAQLPPNPNEIDIAASIAASRDARTSGNVSSRSSGSTVSMPVVPAMKPSRIISSVLIDSCAPHAPSGWPVKPFVDENAGTSAPNTASSATSSSPPPPAP